MYLTSYHDSNDIWNIGNHLNKVTINYLAKRVKELTNSPSKISHIDPKTIYGPLYAEAWDKIPDPKKIQTELDWKTTKTVDEIILDVINFWKNK